MKAYFTYWTEWYWKRFDVHSKECINYKKAWEQTEQEHFDKFQFNKYDDYTQFRTAKSQRQAAKREIAGHPDQMTLF